MPFKFNPITHHLDLVDTVNASGIVQTLTGDTGGAVSPSSGNINILGHNDLSFTGSGSTLQGSNQTKETPYVVGATGYAYSTIQSAINAASLAGGGLVLITRGTYTENLTLKINVGLLAAEANVDNLNVNIIGTHTPDTANGIMTFRGLNFYGTTSIFLSAAAGQGYLSFEECNWILSSNGYIFDILNWVGPTGLVPGSNGVAIMGCGDLSTAASGFLRNTAGMNFALINSYIGSYVGGGSSLPLISTGRGELCISDIYCPISFQGGTGSFIEDCGIHGVGATATGSSSGYIANCIFDSLSSAAFTMSSSGRWSISSTTIDTSNNPAIAGSGSGTLTLGGVAFLNNSNVAVTLTIAGATGFIAGNLQNHGLILGRGARPLSALGIGTNGQIPIGSTGNDPVLATLTAGAGIAITNSAGSISIATSASLGSWVKLVTLTASASASLVFTSTYITSAYSTYVVVMNDLLGSAGAVVNVNFSVDNGANYLNTNYLSGGWFLPQSSNAITNFNSTSTVEIFPGASNFVSSGTMWFYNLASANPPACQGDFILSVGAYWQKVTGYNSTTGGVNNLQFIPASGNFTSGTLTLYGIV